MTQTLSHIFKGIDTDILLSIKIWEIRWQGLILEIVKIETKSIQLFFTPQTSGFFLGGRGGGYIKFKILYALLAVHFFFFLKVFPLFIHLQSWSFTRSFAMLQS